MAKTSRYTPLSPWLFADSDKRRYSNWKTEKLRAYPEDPSALFVDLPTDSPSNRHAIDRMRSCIAKTNMAFYRRPDLSENKIDLLRITAALGLNRLDHNICADDDAVTSLEVKMDGRHQGYIPYSNRPLSWHTDGYYNDADHQVRAWALHCVRPATEGGENALLDPEIAYILLRDRDPALVAALMHPQAMTIPANDSEGTEIRGAVTGPVFSVDSSSGSLHLRYSARKRNIEWRNDPATLEAAAALEEILTGDTPYIWRHKLAAGEGVISNNALHNRTGFSDNKPAGRLIYRARFYDRVQGTEFNTVYGRV
ncbi:MAG: TauD/TfdA family dioxygenase [Chromatiales bacterium]|nr:TauD/TfdA family dioxygenase [Chromatiales bacterium]